MDSWLADAMRLFYGAFLVGFGAVVLVGAARLNDIRRFFRRGERTPELEAALARRADLESLSPLPWRVGGAVAMLCGALVLTRVIGPIVGYALACASLALPLGWTFARLRNHGLRRAAVLAPRRPDAVLSRVWLVLGALAGLAPLITLRIPAYRLSGAIVTFAALVIWAAVVVVRDMPALLSGEDPECEMQIESRLRERRTLGLFGVMLGIPFAFFSLVGPLTARLGGAGSHPFTLLMLVAYLYVVAVWCASFMKLGVRVFRVKARGPVC